jgi:hypothetical protein
MKKKEFEKLLGFADQKDHTNLDFSGFKDPAEAKKQFEELLFFVSKRSDFESDFSPFFTEKVMNGIVGFNNRLGIEAYLSMQFSRVMTLGLTAVVFVFIALYFLQGQEGIRNVLGTDQSNDINFISYLFYEF